MKTAHAKAAAKSTESARPAHGMKGGGRTHRAAGRLFGASAGQPLEPAIREEMEQGFGADFSAVRVHTGGSEARTAHRFGALAYTHGADIVFAPGQYTPATQHGRRLLAHELAHVVQQSDGAGATPSATPQGPTEIDATRAASQVVAGSRAVVQMRSAVGIARQAGGAAGQVVGSVSESGQLINACAILDSIKQVGSNAWEVTVNGQTRHLTDADRLEVFKKVKLELVDRLIRVRNHARSDSGAYQTFKNTWPNMGGAIRWIGNVRDPGPELMKAVGEAQAAVESATAALRDNHFVQTARLWTEAEAARRRSYALYQQFEEETGFAAGGSLMVAEYTRDAAAIALLIIATVATAGAAAGLTSVAGLEIGSVTAINAISLAAPLAQKAAEAGARLALGDQVDWGGLAAEAIVDAILYKFGGSLSAGVAKGMIARGLAPAAKGLGQQVVTHIVGGVLVGNAANVAKSVIRGVVNRLTGQKVTVAGVIEEVKEAFLDPKQQLLGIFLAAVGGYASSRAPAPTAPRPAQPKPTERKIELDRNAPKIPGPAPAHNERDLAAPAGPTPELDEGARPATPAPAHNERDLAAPAGPTPDLDTGPRPATAAAAHNERDLPAPTGATPALDTAPRPAAPAPAHNERDLAAPTGPTPELNKGAATGSQPAVDPSQRDLGPTPAAKDVPKTTTSQKPIWTTVDKGPGKPPDQRYTWIVPPKKPGYGPASAEPGGTEARTGVQFHEYNAAEASNARLRIDYDPVAGRPRSVEYEVHAGPEGEGQITDRAFARDTSTPGKQPTSDDFKGTNLERGHLAPRKTFAGDTEAERASDLTTNVVGMTNELNQGEAWRAAEEAPYRYVRPVSKGGRGLSRVTVRLEPIYDDPPKLSLKDGAPVPKAIRRTVTGPNGEVIEAATYLNR